MADKKDMQSGGGESHNDSSTANNGMHMPGVDFEDMNFEQRRAPYNSGHRFINDTHPDRSGKNETAGHKQK